MSGELGFQRVTKPSWLPPGVQSTSEIGFLAKDHLRHVLYVLNDCPESVVYEVEEATGRTVLHAILLLVETASDAADAAEACMEGLVRRVPQLASRKDNNENTPLHIVVRGSDAALLLRHASSTVKTTNRWGRTPLHVCAAGGHLEAVRVLLSHDASVAGCADPFEMSPIHSAIDNGDVDMVHLICEHHPASAEAEFYGVTVAQLVC